MKRFLWALRFWCHYAIWHGVTERPFSNGLDLYDRRVEGLEWLIELERTQWNIRILQGELWIPEVYKEYMQWLDRVSTKRPKR